MKAATTTPMRAGHEQKFSFHFRIHEKLRKLMPKDGIISVRVEIDGKEVGRPETLCLPYEGHATDGGEKLQEMLSTKYHVDHWGGLKMPFGKAPGRKKLFLDEYQQVRSLMSLLGHDLYLTGGNLLGAIREFDFLPHDDDLDSSFCLHAKGPVEASIMYIDFLKRLLPAVAALGGDVRFVNPGQLNLAATRGGTGIDMMVGWLQPDGMWYRFTSFGGMLGVPKFRTREIGLLGQTVLVPQYAERELEITYGVGWKHPDPGYSPSRKQEINKVLSTFEGACSGSFNALREHFPQLRSKVQFLSGDMAGGE